VIGFSFTFRDRTKAVTDAAQKARIEIATEMSERTVEDIRKSIQTKQDVEESYSITIPWLAKESIGTDSELLRSSFAERMAFRFLRAIPGARVRTTRQQELQANDGVYRRRDNFNPFSGQSEYVKIRDSSPPGKPPKTKGVAGKNLRDAIQYRITPEGDAVIYVDESVGPIGGLMEFGGERFGNDYEPRPFLRPGLEQNADAFGAEYQGAIGE